MRELLIKENQLNWKFILPVSIAFGALSLFSGISNLTHFGHVEANLKLYYMFTVCFNACYSFVQLTIWALALQQVQDKVKSIVLPAILLGVFGLAMQFLFYFIHPSSSDESGNLLKLVLHFAISVILPWITVAFCELFYTKFRNKILLFITSGMVTNIVSIIYNYFQYAHGSDGWISTAIFIQYIMSAFMQYGLVLFIMKWQNIPLPIDNTAEKVRRTALRASISETLKNTEEPAAVLPAMQAQFPDLSFNKIVNEFIASASPYKFKDYQVANAFLIVIQMVSVVYAIVILGGITMRNFGIHSGYFDWDSIGYFVLQLFPFILIVIKLKLAGDMFSYRAYTYKLVALLAMLSCCFNAYELFRNSSDFLAVASFLLNALIVGIALTIAYNLYPHYHLIFKRQYAFEDLVVKPHAPGSANESTV